MLIMRSCPLQPHEAVTAEVWERLMTQWLRRNAEASANLFVVNATTPAQECAAPPHSLLSGRLDSCSLPADGHPSCNVAQPAAPSMVPNSRTVQAK